MSPLTILCLAVIAVSAVLGEETQSDIDQSVFDEIAEWEGRIVGGKNAAPGQFPYQVALRTANGNHRCGGSILAAHFVLSAAHCFQTHPAFLNSIRVVVGAHRINDGVVHTLSAGIHHPEYNRARLANDIGVIRTELPIVFNTVRVRPIRLTNQATPDNFPLVLSGWGQTAHIPRRPLPEVLQYKFTVSFNREQCMKRLGRTRGTRLHEKAFCTTNPINRGACIGDSGSPLVGQDGAQYGVVSWGVPCAQGLPDVYASVFHYLNWIESVTR